LLLKYLGQLTGFTKARLRGKFKEVRERGKEG